jgi:hypothetical protein
MTEVQTTPAAEAPQTFGLDMTADEQNAEVERALPIVDLCIAMAPDFGQGVKTMLLRAQGLLLAVSCHTGPQTIIDLLQQSTIPALQNHAASLAAEADGQADTTH